MSRRTRQSRMAHLCCAMLAGIGTSTIASSAFAQVDSLVKTGQSQAPKDVLSVANYKMELLMGPIDGLTTAWHPAPTETAVPLGTVVEFKVNAPEGAVVQWENAVQTLQSDNAAYAVAICSSPGVDSITCRVNYEGQRFSKELSWDVIPVQASDMIIREVTIREETLEAPALHGMELNLWTMSKFFGASIADIEQVEDGRYVTSVRRAMQVHADVFPPEFAPLVEWRANGVAKGLGASRILSVNEAGMHQLSAGRPDAPASLDLVTYETVITSHNVLPVINNPDQEFFPEGVKIGVTAETNPAGFEDRIRWVSSTKFGTAYPVTGQGPNFYTVFNGTIDVTEQGFLFQWLGVKADNHAMGQDQKGGACCLDDGSCVEVVITECLGLGGSFQGVDTVCANVDCPLPPTDGACCLPDGSCFNTMNAGGADECAAAGGDYQGNGVFCADVTCPPPPITNDDCEDRITVTGGSIAFDLTGATTDGANEPTCDFPFGGPDNQNINQDIWYNYVAECDGTLFVDTCGSGGIDTRLAIYDGCACPTGTPIECNDDFGNATEGDSGFPCPAALEASLSIPVTAGNCYKIRVGAFSAGGTVGGADVLNITCVAVGAGGGCCLPDGSCIDVADAAECGNSGGDYQGDGFPCALVTCPQPLPCGPGSGDCFTPNGTPGCDDVACCELICGLDPFCCDTEWDGLCADAAAVNCSVTGQGACCLENGLCVTTATAADCDAQGGTFQGDGTTCGTVMCPQPPVCGDGAGDCFVANGTPGCDNVECCETVCAADAFCCDTEWDALCVSQAIDLCDNPPGGACCFSDGSCVNLTQELCDINGGAYQGEGNFCAGVVCENTICGPGSGDCFTPNGTPGCDDVACCELICGLDPFCCDTEWDGLCADAAATNCGFTGGACCFADGSCTNVADAGECDIAGGDYQGDGNGCAVVACPQPPACGPGTGDCFSPNGTPGCEDVACCELICSLDPFCCDTEWDQLCADAALTQCDVATGDACCLPDGSCIAVTDEAQCNDAGGTFQGAGIACGGVTCPQPSVCGPGAGDCFAPNGTVGCDDVACCELICGLDPFCCESEWDQICADAAVANCSTTP